MNLFKAILKIIICFLLSIFSLNLNAQCIEFSGGVNRNSFYDYQKNEGHFKAIYTSDFGYSIGVGVNDILQKSIPLKFGIRLDNYKGKFYTTDGGLGGASTTEANVEKNTIGIELYPLNIKIFNKIRLNFGVEFSVLLNETTTGYKSSWKMFEPSIILDVNMTNIHKNYYYGFCGQLSYEFNIIQNWYLSPQYRFYWGLSEEFVNVEARILSYRHNFEMVIAMHIN